MPDCLPINEHGLPGGIMVRIAFVLLCHKDVEGVISQAEGLTAAGDCIAIHFDARARAADYTRLRAALADNPRVTFAARRVKCGWGEWSLVEATLEAVKAAYRAFPEATHFYMLSGDCMPVKSAEFARDLLAAEDADYIEAFDFRTSGWIRTGLREERLIYRHYFNERGNKRAFYAAMNLQKWLGLERRPPADIQVMIGSQWWCLRRQTIAEVLDFTRSRPDVLRFFRTTWIPDETYFQTLVAHLVPRAELRLRTLTFLIFSDYGMPVTFHDDHYDLLLAQDYLFARKVSAEALELRARLRALWASGRKDFTISGGGRRLYEFLAWRGREGRRFAPRIWEASGSIGRDRELLVIACKKWHVGRRLARRIRDRIGIHSTGYLFSEAEADLPALGGLEATLDKRHRHRRALLRLLFDYHQTDRLVICIDPGQIDLLQDFLADACHVRVLDVECSFSDDYLAGHAQRVGLVGAEVPETVMEGLLPTLRHDLAYERTRLRNAAVTQYHRISETRSTDENAEQLAEFLEADIQSAAGIAEIETLYGD